MGEGCLPGREDKTMKDEDEPHSETLLGFPFPTLQKSNVKVHFFQI